MLARGSIITSVIRPVPFMLRNADRFSNRLEIKTGIKMPGTSVDQKATSVRRSRQVAAAAIPGLCFDRMNRVKTKREKESQSD